MSVLRSILPVLLALVMGSVLVPLSGAELKADDSMWSMFDESAGGEVDNDIEGDFDSIKSHRLKEQLNQRVKSHRKTSAENEQLCCAVKIKVGERECVPVISLTVDHGCRFLTGDERTVCFSKAESEARKGEIRKRNWNRQQPIVREMCRAIQEGRHAETQSRMNELRDFEHKLEEALRQEDRLAAQRLEEAREEARRSEQAVIDRQADKDREIRERRERERLAQETQRLKLLGGCKKLWAADRHHCACAALPELPARFEPATTCEE